MFINPTSDTYNQKKARELCVALGDDWDLPDCQSSKDQLQYFLNITNLNNAWTSIEKLKHPTWLWVNGSNCKFKMYSLENGHQKGCAYYQ